MERQFTVSFSEFRCHVCNQYYATETRAGAAACPYCSHKQIAELRSLNDRSNRAHLERLQRLERSNRALRGVISRTKGGK